LIARNLALLTLVVFLSVLVVLSLESSAALGTEEDAKLTQVEYSARIRATTSDTWRFTVYNANCSENDQGVARFFFEFYVDNELWFDEYNATQYRTWNCSKGSTVSHSYNIRGWSTIRPVTHDLRIELYWYSNSTVHLEDVTSFEVAVTVLISLQHVYATGYLAVYMIACFLLFSYDYVAGLDQD
jgi:hypothetical protein